MKEFKVNIGNDRVNLGDIRTASVTVVLVSQYLFRSMFYFSTSWKRRKTRAFLTFSGGKAVKNIQQNSALFSLMTFKQILDELFFVEVFFQNFVLNLHKTLIRMINRFYGKCRCHKKSQENGIKSELMIT